MAAIPRKRCGKENRPSLSLKKKRKTTESKRFAFVNPKEVEAEKDKFIPQNTDKSTQWAVKAFTDWAISRKEAGEDAPPEIILLTHDRKVLCNWLCTFFLEVRKFDGTKYCPRSLASLLAGIHRHIEAHSRHKVQIQRQEEFEPLHTLLENLYRKLHSEGIGTTKNQAEVISLHEEKQLWATEALTYNTPQGLLNAVFYYNGINFCLRGGDEHRNLHESQLHFGSDSASREQVEYVDYVEHGSKNRPGGTKQLNLDNKTVRQYAQPASGEQCHIYLLKLYFSKLPPTPDGQPRKAFYYKPLTKCTYTDVTWFSSVPIGHNTLKGMLKAIFISAGLDYSSKTNTASGQHQFPECMKQMFLKK